MGFGAVIGDGVGFRLTIQGALDRRQGTVAVLQDIVDRDSRIEQIVQPVEGYLFRSGVGMRNAVDVLRELIRQIGEGIAIVVPLVLHINIIDGGSRIVGVHLLIGKAVARQGSVLIEGDYVCVSRRIRLLMERRGMLVMPVDEGAGHVFLIYALGDVVVRVIMFKEILRSPQGDRHRVGVVRVPDGVARTNTANARCHTPVMDMVNLTVQGGPGDMQVHVDLAAGVCEHDQRRIAAERAAVCHGIGERIGALAGIIDILCGSGIACHPARQRGVRLRIVGRGRAVAGQDLLGDRKAVLGLYHIGDTVGMGRGGRGEGREGFAVREVLRIPYRIRRRIRIVIRIPGGEDQVFSGDVPICVIYDLLDPVVVVEGLAHISGQADGTVVQGDDGGRLGIEHHIQARITCAGVEPARSVVLGEAQSAPGILDQHVGTRFAGIAGVCRGLMVQVNGVFRVRRADGVVKILNAGARNRLIRTDLHSIRRCIQVSFVAIYGGRIQPVHGIVAAGDGGRYVGLDNCRGNHLRERCRHSAVHIGDLGNIAADLHQHIFDLRRFELVIEDVEDLVICQHHIRLGRKGSVYRLILGAVDQVDLAVAGVVIDMLDGVLLDMLYQHALFFDRGESAAIGGVFLLRARRDPRGKGQVSRRLMFGGQGDGGVAVGRAVVICVDPGSILDGRVVRGVQNLHVERFGLAPNGIQIQRTRHRLREIVIRQGRAGGSRPAKEGLPRAARKRIVGRPARDAADMDAGLGIYGSALVQDVRRIAACPVAAEGGVAVIGVEMIPHFHRPDGVEMDVDVLALVGADAVFAAARQQRMLIVNGLRLTPAGENGAVPGEPGAFVGHVG